MQSLAASELIINSRGAIYHLDLLPEELADHIITVGDPSRVKEVSKFFDSIEVERSHREFMTHTGYLGKLKLSVISTGIGTDNIDIVLNELDALANINLSSRSVKANMKQLNIIRIGTTGSLQNDVPVDSFVANTHAIGIDNLMNFYHQQNNEEEKQILHSFVTHTQLHTRYSHPYIAGAAMSLIKQFVKGFHQGITVTCPGFYGPQGRVLRLGLSMPHLNDRLSDFNFGNHRITNFEMETAGIYGLGKALRHNCLSLSAVVANRVNKDFSKDAQASINDLIRRTLEIISEIL
jgi:uridine phosphorylase